MPHETPAERALLRATSSWLERVIGVIALIVGLFLAVVTFTLGRTSFNRAQTPSVGIYVLLGVVLVLILFFAIAGLRLLLQTPNRFGSLFSPWVWFAISATLLLLVVVFIVVGVKQATLNTAQGAISGLLLALLSYGAGSHFRRKAREANGAA